MTHLSTKLQRRALERSNDVELERNISNNLEMRVEDRHGVRSLALQLAECRGDGDGLANNLGPERREQVELEREGVKGVDLEGESFSLVGKRENDRVRDGDRVGFRSHDELERGLSTASGFAQLDGRREGNTANGSVGVAEEDLDEGLLVEVAVAVCDARKREVVSVDGSSSDGRLLSVQIRKGMMGGGSDKDGMRSDSRSMGSRSAEDKLPPPGIIWSAC